MFRRNRTVGLRRGAAIAMAASGVIAWSPAEGEPAKADAALAVICGDHRSVGRPIRTFTVNGAALSVTAEGRFARADTQMTRDLIDEARAMRKVMPGYPQPAYLTLDVSVAF